MMKSMDVMCILLRSAKGFRLSFNHRYPIPQYLRVMQGEDAHRGESASAPRFSAFF